MKKVQLNKFGTFFDLFIFDENFSDEKINKLRKKISEEFENYENIFSKFRENSELSKINQDKEGEFSKDFLKLFNLTEEINILTNGFFNPFVEIEKLGKKENFLKKFFNKGEKNFKKNKNFFIEKNKISLKKNINIDLGGIGKGYFVDIISEKLKGENIEKFLINFGGDIYANGKNGDKNFRIGIENPFLIGKKIGYVDLENQSISSSGRYFKNWEIEGKKYHHIINPFTNSNETEIQMITIISEKTYFSDSIATAVFNMGIKKGINFLEKNNIDGIIIGENKKAIFTKGFREKFNFNENLG